MKALSISALCITTALTVGCGPNYRYAYDGEGAFERCYGLDFDTQIDNAQRARCWSDWLGAYASAASSERTEYARTRISALQSNDSRSASAPPPAPSAERIHTPPAEEGAQRPSGATLGPGVIVTPPQPPTSPQGPAPAPGAAGPVDVDRANAPSPAVGDPWRGRVSTGGNPIASPPPTQSLGAEPPGASCANDCRSAWSGSSARCASRDAACVARCDESYRDCMRGCF